jgi:hypothetical protein
MSDDQRLPVVGEMAFDFALKQLAPERIRETLDDFSRRLGDDNPMLLDFVSQLKTSVTRIPELSGEHAVILIEFALALTLLALEKAADGGGGFPTQNRELGLRAEVMVRDLLRRM